MTALFKGHFVSCEAKGWAGTSVEAGRPVRLMQESRRNTTVAGGRKQSVGSGDDEKCSISKYILEIQPERPAGS